MSHPDHHQRTLLQLPIESVAGVGVAHVLDQVGSGPAGLSEQEAAARLAGLGPNAVVSHRVSGWVVMRRQWASPILILLMSVGPGFLNEFRAERAAESCTPGSRTRPSCVATAGR